jgi:hypothetical protein
MFTVLSTDVDVSVDNSEPDLEEWFFDTSKYGARRMGSVSRHPEGGSFQGELGDVAVAHRA